ncbi:MAG: polymer-forming cytoskeletal protein [Oscillospiraceae bacterium]
MADKTNSNFKTALNELLSGKVTTDSPVEKINVEFDGEVTSGLSSSASAPINYGAAKKSGAETVITEDVIIEGNISSSSKLRILGEVTGSVTSTDDLVIAGKVGGEIKGNGILLIDCSVTSDIISSGEVTISDNSNITGDIKADRVISGGVIKGGINAKTVTLKTSSRTFGDISCESITIERGASLKGRLETVGD